MARPPVTDEELIARYGPHLNEAPPGGWNAGLTVDKVVKTHCCFCGQQCVFTTLSTVSPAFHPPGGASLRCGP